MISSTAPWEALRLKPSSPASRPRSWPAKDADQETDLIFTQDTHDEAYSETQEGRKLPVPHCLKDTRGWRICKQLLPYTMWATILEKPSFGCPALVDEVRDYDRLVLMGLCTDICVIANAMLLKAFYPEKEIIVDSTCCAGSTRKTTKEHYRP